MTTEGIPLAQVSREHRRKMQESVSPRTYVLRGFIKQVDEGRYVGVCLKPNLVVEADSKDEAFQKLHELIRAYTLDAARDGQLDYFMSRRAPAKFYAEYAVGRAQTLLHALNKPFLTFTETCNIPQYA